MDDKTLVNKPKTKRGRETLDRILSAAAQAFYEKGYHAASINDITRLAGVASGTFYVYFESKYDLYRFLLLRCSRMIRTHLHQATRGCRTRREVEEVGLRAWLQFVQKNPCVCHVIWESRYIDKQLFMDSFVNFSRAYMKGIDAAREAGELRSDIDSEVLAFILMGASSFLGLNWGLFKDCPADRDKVVSSFMTILEGGMFREESSSVPESDSLPVRIQVEFDDDDGVPDNEE